MFGHRGAIVRVREQRTRSAALLSRYFTARIEIFKNYYNIMMLKLQTYTWNCALLYNFISKYCNNFNTNFLHIFECWHLKHFNIGSVIPRLRIGLILLHSITPWGIHPGDETCKSFNNCYELYFIKSICWMCWFLSCINISYICIFLLWFLEINWHYWKFRHDFKLSPCVECRIVFFG